VQCELEQSCNIHSSVWLCDRTFAVCTGNCTLTTLGKLWASQGAGSDQRLCCYVSCDIGLECEPSCDCTWEVNLAVTAHGLNLAVTAYGLNLAVTAHALSLAVTAHGVNLAVTAHGVLLCEVSCM